MNRSETSQMGRNGSKWAMLHRQTNQLLRRNEMSKKKGPDGNDSQIDLNILRAPEVCHGIAVISSVCVCVCAFDSYFGENTLANRMSARKEAWICWVRTCDHFAHGLKHDNVRPNAVAVITIDFCELTHSGPFVGVCWCFWMARVDTIHNNNGE